MRDVPRERLLYDEVAGMLVGKFEQDKPLKKTNLTEIRAKPGAFWPLHMGVFPWGIYRGAYDVWAVWVWRVTHGRLKHAPRVFRAFLVNLVSVEKEFVIENWDPMLELQALPRRYGRTEATCETSFPGSYATLRTCPLRMRTGNFGWLWPEWLGLLTHGMWKEHIPRVFQGRVVVVVVRVITLRSSRVGRSVTWRL